MKVLGVAPCGLGEDEHALHPEGTQMNVNNNYDSPTFVLKWESCVSVNVCDSRCAQACLIPVRGADSFHIKT